MKFRNHVTAMSRRAAINQTKGRKGRGRGTGREREEEEEGDVQETPGSDAGRVSSLCNRCGVDKLAGKTGKTVSAAGREN